MSGGAAPDLGGIGLIVFDKDGTLIDFETMWAGWVEDLAQRLGVAAGHALERDLYASIGFDPASGRAAARSPLAVLPMAGLRRLTERVVAGAAQLSPDAAARVVEECWRPPDPVALARPLADLSPLFSRLRAAGIAVALATSDDRSPTEATLRALGVGQLVDVVVCADDGVEVKPSPAPILLACDLTGVQPAGAAVVGDAPADLQMGRAAHAGLTVGVLSGVGTREELEPLADVVLPSIAALGSMLPPDRGSQDPGRGPARMSPGEGSPSR